MVEQEELITAAEAARRLGVSRQRIHELARVGRLGRLVAGQYWVFTPAEIESYRSERKPGRPKSDSDLETKTQGPEFVAA